jgi:PAS domain S-box-containing protein
MHTGDPDKSSLSPGLIDLQNPGVMAGFLEIAFDAVVAFDAQERITHWNPAAEQMYGWAAQEALGKTPARLFWPVSTPEEKKDRKQRQSRLKRGETLRGEHESCRKDGSSLRVQYTARAVFGAEGKLSGYIAVYRDISAQVQDTTEHKQTEEDLRARTEEIETLLEVSPVAIFVAHDPECVRITGNPAGYRMVGLPENPDLNISKSAPVQERPTYRTFRNGVEVPASDLPMQKAARLGVEVREDELELRFEDGSQKFLYAFAKPLFDSQGKSRGAIATMLDITERKRAEDQLERSNQKLNEILASIQDDFYVIDHNWIFVYANRQFTSKLGKEPEDLIRNNVWKLFPKHVGMALEENFRAAMEKRQIRRFEIPGQYTNAWYRITVFPSPEGITVLGSDITEHKRLQAETESMAKFPQENPNPVLRVSQEGVVLFGNRASQKIFAHWNCSIGTPIPQMWREKVTEQFRLGVPGEAILECNGRIFLLQLVPILENHYLNIYGRDITERRQAEEALRASEERLRQMIETSLVAIGFGDSTGKIFGANMAFYRLTGYSREEIQASQLGWDRLTAPEYAELDRQMIAMLDATGSAGPYEKEYIRKDGSRVPLLLTISKLPGHDEHIAFLMDITERKRAEQALAQAMQELQGHINNSPLAIVAFDPEYRITEWSAGAERMFGWHADELLNKMIAEFRWVHEDDAQRVASLSADMFAGRTMSNVHANRNYRKDGSLIECEWYNSALLDAHGKLISVRSQVLDVTERKRAEEALRENQKQLQLLNETLEQKVHEKTAEVRRLSSDLIKAVQQERHRISHILHDDLQQRIYAIQMQLTFLHDALQEQNETTRQEVPDIERQLGEILTVTRNLSIDLSPPILRDEGLSQAIHWLAARMRQRYGLPIELQADGPFGISNEELHVLLFNCVRELLFNVVKHAQASRAVVTLQWSDGGIQIEVRDDGKGFQVKTPVQPAGGEMNEENGSQSSSGLATMRHQLSLFDGRMEIQSQPGAGTRVVLILPITEPG